ncbi:MAG: helix-turn-helix transcriptional regulator [Actinomycetota bacterium]|nr:helix-turn-helix transcriptional regulator [Actinomycetota bacterium]
MAKRKLDDLGCTLANGVDVFGDRWSLLVLRDAFLGVRRFDEFHRDLGIARNVLADRLDRLVKSGIMETRPYQERPVRHEYVLTDKGADLLDVLLALWRWGDRWDPVATEQRRVMTHRGCGAETQGVTTCAGCGEPLFRDDLRMRPLLPVVAERLTADAPIDPRTEPVAALSGPATPTTSG